MNLNKTDIIIIYTIFVSSLFTFEVLLLINGSLQEWTNFILITGGIGFLIGIMLFIFYAE